MRFNKDILEFTATRQHFDEFGVYTKLALNTTQWKAFWAEEKRRCLEGYYTGSDFIPGYFYFYLNYSRIRLTTPKEGNQNSAAVDRIEAFPEFWDGDYDFFHYLDEAENSGNHAMMLASRGKGKSFKGGSMLNRNYFLIPNSTSFAFAASEQYLTGDGLITKAWNIMDFIDQNTPWAKRRQFKNTDLHRRASVQSNENGIKTEKGFKSEIIGVTVGDNINKLRGKRGKLMILEEIGSFPKSHTGWNILRPSVEQGNKTFGLLLAFGTGGEEGAAFDGAEELFKNPQAYKIHPVTNKWDEGMENTQCSYFWSAAQNFAGAYDKWGNSDILVAKKLIEEDRANVKKGSDPHALTRRMAELPLNPREAMMKITGTQFPVADIRAQEAEIESKPHMYKNADYVGRFELNADKQKYEFIYDSTLTPIYKSGFVDNKNKPGAIVLYELVKTDDQGEIPSNRYVAGIDSYDFDESTTNSLGSCFVFDSWTKHCVAEYTGRPAAFDFYENCRRLLLYFNAKVNIENANKGIFDYFDNKNCGYLICEEPRIAREALQEGIKTGSRRRGTTPSTRLNAYARGLIARWLLEPTNNPDRPEEMQVHKFRCLPALQELAVWNIDGNFDRVSALGMAMLIMQDREKYNIETMATKEKPDPFWDRHFKKKSYSGYKIFSSNGIHFG